jgi:hypothetical protein
MVEVANGVEAAGSIVGRVVEEAVQDRFLLRSASEFAV